MIPQESENGIDYADLVALYLKTIVRDGIKMMDDGPFFYTGKSSLKRASKFVNSPLGANALADTGKVVAKKLDLPDPDHYTGHCWSR